MRENSFASRKVAKKKYKTAIISLWLSETFAGFA
jgi:hypothetical protein